MPGADLARRRGRRGRRTHAMIRIAGERIRDLFALAEVEAQRPDAKFGDRYVDLARRVGTRYNVRFPPEFAERYCRGCSAFWIEGRTVRTRLRHGHRAQTCLRCGRVRRVPLAPRPRTARPPPSGSASTDRSSAAALVDDGPEDPDDGFGDDGLDE